MDAATDYCDTPDEVAKNPEAKYWLQRAANGDEGAFSFLWRFWCFTQCFDDLIDGDKPVDPQLAMRELVMFVDTLTNNDFYRHNKSALFGLMVQAATRAMDGDEWEKSEDSIKRIASHVLRCGDIDLVMHVAFLTGGWDHMRSLKDLRTYDSNGVEQAELRLIKTGA